MRHGIISSCQSVATSETVKRFWNLDTSLTHVSSAIASISSTFTFTFTFIQLQRHVILGCILEKNA